MLIESIAVTPVKGLGLNRPASVGLTETGVLGDRRYAMVDARGGVANSHLAWHRPDALRRS
jgi:uncharacterized protein YcbX